VEAANIVVESGAVFVGNARIGRVPAAEAETAKASAVAVASGSSGKAPARARVGSKPKAKAINLPETIQ